MDETPGKGELFRLLANERRRHAIACLREHVSMTLADLADETAVREYDAPLNEISAETVTRVYLSLYHCHVPMLERVEFARYDQELDRVELTDRGRDVDLPGFD